MKKSLFMMVAIAAAITSYGCGSGSNPAAPSTSIDSAPPQAPVGLVQTLDGSNHAVLQWTANSESDLSAYQVYQYSPDPTRDNAYALVATVPATQTSWPLPYAPAPTTTYVKLCALDQSGNRSAESAALEVTLQKAPAGTEPPSLDPGAKLH